MSNEPISIRKISTAPARTQFHRQQHLWWGQPDTNIPTREHGLPLRRINRFRKEHRATLIEPVLTATTDRRDYLDDMSTTSLRISWLHHIEPRIDIKRCPTSRPDIQQQRRAAEDVHIRDHPTIVKLPGKPLEKITQR